MTVRRRLTPAVLVAAAGLLSVGQAAFAQEDRLRDTPDGRDLQEMSVEERRAFINERRQEAYAQRMRARFESEGLSDAEIERRVQEAVRERFGDDPAAEPRELREAQAGDAAPIEAAPMDPDAMVEFEEGEPVELRFPGPVSLQQLVDVVGGALGINIFADAGLNNETIVVSAPVEVPQDELLTLLSTLLEDRGYVLVRDEQGFFRITRGEVPIDLGGGRLSTTRIIPTPNLMPSGLEQMLTTILGAEAAGGQRPGGGTTLRITALDELGVIVATGGASRLNKMEQLIDLLVEERARQRLHILRVENVAARYARDRMIELQGRLEQAAQATPRVQRPGQPGVVAAGGSLSRLGERLFPHSGNTLIFRGTEEELPEVEDLLRVVDTVSELIAKRYQAGGVTSEVVRAAESLGLGESEEIEQDQNALAFNRARAQQLGQQGDEGGPGDSRFLVDPASGSFIYFGTETQHDVVASLVERFRQDMIDNGTQIRVYKLVYARAGSGSGGGGGGLAGGGLGGGGGGGGGGGAGGAVQTVPGEQGVAELLRELIADPGADRATGRFLPGSGAGDRGAASEVQDQMIEAQQRGLSAIVDEALGGTRLVATEDNTVIVADNARNQLLIKAPALAHQQFETIIKELDQRQPQVQVDIQLITITLDDSFRWSTAYDFNIGDFNLSSLFGAAGGTDNITDLITVPAGSPGLTAGVINSDYVPFAINTLASLAESTAVSRPRLLVSDNQTATLNSTEIEPFLETTQNANTTTTSQGGTAEAGTVLEITPRISDAGEITLNFSVELSAFTGEAENGLQPPELTNLFESQVTLPTNTTIIVGGFESTTDSEQETGIPLLKDIPLVGNLFKSTIISSDRRAVFVFITPTILDDPADRGLRLLTEGPMKEAQIDDRLPVYEPVVIPVRRSSAGEPDGRQAMNNPREDRS